MPLKVKVKLAFIFGVALSLVLFVYMFLGVFFSLGLVAFYIYLLFVYYPPFDLSKCYILKKKQVLLSFDDGPTENFTDKILDILKDKEVKAVFFAIGHKLENNMELARRIVAEGHVLANHTYSHKKLHRLSRSEINAEILKTHKILEKIYGEFKRQVPLVFRAPHGFKSFVLKSYLKRKGYCLFAWTRGVWDTDSPGAEWIYKKALARGSRGEVLLFHDGLGIGKVSQKQKDGLLKALPEIIDAYRANGYTFKSLEDVLRKA